MSFFQVYYTSCERGLRSGKGFQLQAASPSLSPRLLEAAERRGLYVPPPSLPTRPEAEELAQFPVALQFEDLGDGMRLLGQARYLGQDYSGRFGNYFSHSFIAPAEAFLAAGLFPIESFGADGWSTQESPSPELAEAAAPPRGGVIRPEAVQAFLLRPENRPLVPAFFSAVGEAFGSRKRMILVGDPQEVACWVAAAAYMLPPRLLAGWTFNTYVKNPYQTDVLLAGVFRREDSDFSFSTHELIHQYNVLDLRGGESSPLPEPSGEWAQMARWCLDGQLAELAACGRFWARVAPSEGAEARNTAASAHAFVQSEGREGFASGAVRYLAPRAARLTPAELQTLRQAWRQTLAGLTEPRRTLEWLDLGQALGTLAQLDARSLYDLGYKHLAEHLHDGAVREGLDRLAASPQGQEVLAGVAERIVAARSLPASTAVGAWLQQGALKAPFEKAALQQRAWPLLCQAAGFGEGDRLLRLERLVSLAPGCDVAEAAALEEACSHLWRSKRPTPSEALALWERLGGRPSETMRIFLASALAAGSLTHLDAGREQLLNRLQGGDSPLRQGDGPPEVEWLQWARQDAPRNQHEAQSYLNRGLTLLQQRPSQREGWPSEWEKEAVVLMVHEAMAMPHMGGFSYLTELSKRHQPSTSQGIEQELLLKLREATPQAALEALEWLGALVYSRHAALELRALKRAAKQTMEGWKGKEKAAFFAELAGDGYASYGFNLLNLPRPRSLRDQLEEHRPTLLFVASGALGLAIIGTAGLLTGAIQWGDPLRGAALAPPSLLLPRGAEAPHHSAAALAPSPQRGKAVPASPRPPQAAETGQGSGAAPSGTARTAPEYGVFREDVATQLFNALTSLFAEKQGNR